jgi:phosphate transport system substrate-binding protein
MIISKSSAIFGQLAASLLALLLLGATTTVSGETLTGAGSSAAAPVYRAWGAAYGRSQDVQLAYESVGSSAGLKKIRAKEVSFGASDAAPSELELTRDQLVLIPTFVTGTVPVVNLPKIGHGKLRLSGEALVGIFQGTITRWNAPEIRSLNPGVTLPDLEIRPVVRSDGSGTTFYFTDYLSRISPAWKDKFGAKTSIAWSAGFIGAKGSDGVVKTVKEMIGAIGYVDFNYVVDHKLNPVRLRNLAGEFVTPGVSAFRAALYASDWSAKGDFHATLSNLPGDNVWPITMGTFVLLPKVSDKSADTARALRFLVWALLEGDQVVENMSFVRLPDKLQALAFKTLSSVTNPQGSPLGIVAMASLSRQKVQ